MLQFRQIKNQNFYTCKTKSGEILKSYNTIVGYIDQQGKLYRTRYTQTTGKQITKYYTTSNQVYVNAEELQKVIKEYEGITINTEYNGYWGCA